MKKVHVLFLMLCLSTLAFAQPEKGNIYLGGNLNFNISSSKTKVGSTSADGPKVFNISITPKVGYFFTDKIAAGLNLGFMMQNTKTEVLNITTKDKKIGYGGGVFARYYAMPTERFGFFFEAAVNSMFGSSKVETGSVTTDGPKFFNLEAGVTPGLAFYVSDAVALEFSYGFLGYESQNEKETIAGEEVKSTNGSFKLNLNPNTLKLGVSILF